MLVASMLVSNIKKFFILHFSFFIRILRSKILVGRAASLTLFARVGLSAPSPAAVARTRGAQRLLAGGSASIPLASRTSGATAPSAHKILLKKKRYSTQNTKQTAYFTHLFYYLKLIWRTHDYSENIFFEFM
jgi:hypothetical protein